VLTINLNRLEFDYTTFDRKKINSRFEFPLEVDLLPFCDEELTAKILYNESKFELKSIIIHAGGAHGGHYHCYTRDDLHEGNWNIELPEQLDADPKPKEKKQTEQEKIEEKKVEDAKE